jgi:hypothetical protein
MPGGTGECFVGILVITLECCRRCAIKESQILVSFVVHKMLIVLLPLYNSMLTFRQLPGDVYLLDPIGYLGCQCGVRGRRINAPGIFWRDMKAICRLIRDHQGIFATLGAVCSASGQLYH